MNKKEMMIFKDGDFEINVNMDLTRDTVWMTQKDISLLFNKGQSTISEHIKNIFNEGELIEKSNIGFSDIANSDKPVKVYNLDVIISVGNRVKSNRGVLFRKWANSVLKQYLLDDYVINERRSDTLDYSKVLGLLNNLRTKNMLTLLSYQKS